MLPGEEKRNKELEITKSILTYALANEQKAKHELDKAKYMIDCLRKENLEFLNDRQVKEKVLKELAEFIFDLYFKVKNNAIWKQQDFDKLRSMFELARSNQGYISLDELDKEKNKIIDEELILKFVKNDCPCKD